MASLSAALKDPYAKHISWQLTMGPSSFDNKHLAVSDVLDVGRYSLLFSDVFTLWGIFHLKKISKDLHKKENP